MGILCMGCGVLISIIIVLVGVYLYTGWAGYNEAPKVFEIQSFLGQVQYPSTFTLDQKEQLLALGYPEVFTILIDDQKTVSGGVSKVPLEIWVYYSHGLG